MKVISRTFKVAAVFGLVTTVLALSASPASAQLFQRRVVVAAPAYYVAPGPVTATTYVAPSAAVVSAPVQAVYTSPVAATAPVAATYTTTTYSSPVFPTTYVAPTVVAPAVRYRVVAPRRVYRYYYYPY
jgi:hypothetical protein